MFWAVRTTQGTTETFESAVLPSAYVEAFEGAWTTRLATPADLPMVIAHLRAYFGTPQTAPFCPLPQPHEVILLATDPEIKGCIRYRYISRVEGRPIHLVDWFCVHPSVRKKGCATALLGALRAWANPRGMPYAMFLKEGAPLPMPSVCSGWYYCRVREPSAPFSALTRCPTALAHRLVALQQSLAPSLTLLCKTAPQEWWLYDTPDCGVLACIQDTEQYLPSGVKMVWFTGWIPFRGVRNAMSVRANEARNAIADQYHAVWFPAMEQWTDPTWKLDGAFHWYTYQWNTSLCVSPKAYVMVT